MATLRTPQASNDILATPEERQQASDLFEPQREQARARAYGGVTEREEIRASDADLAKLQSEQKIGVKKAGVEATQSYIQDVERQQGEYRNKISANPLPTHKPTQEDLSTYAQIGSAMMTMGLMLGAGGKANAKLGMDAMTGMMNGWRKGRQDLWKQEAINFEKAFNKIKADREAIYKNLQEGLKLASTNYAASKEKLETAAFIAGEGSILKKQIENRNLKGIAEYRNEIQRVNDSIEENVRKAAGVLAQERLRKEEAERQARAKIEAARIRATAAEKKGGGGLLKPGAEVTKAYLSQNALLSDMQDIAKDLKDPKIRKLITEYRLEAFASEGFTTTVSQLAMDQIPSELRQFLTKVAYVRNNYYRTTSGLTVTGQEAMRNYNVVPTPGDSPERLADKAETMINQVNRTVKQYQSLYGLPPIDSETLNTFRTPGENFNFDARSLPVQDDSGSMANAATTAFGSYDPSKYTYGYENGRLWREAK